VIDPIQAGQELMISGNYQEALELFKQIFTEEPHNDNALYHLGLCYYAFERYEEAQEAFLACLEINPRNVDALVDLGESYFAQEDAARALKTFKKAQDLDPESARALISLARVQEFLGQDLEAVENFEAAMELAEPGEAPSYDLALVYAKVGRYLDADLLLENLITETLRKASQALAGDGDSRDDLSEFIKEMKDDRSNIQEVFEEEYDFSLDIPRHMFRALELCQSLRGEEIRELSNEISLLFTMGLENTTEARGIKLQALSGSFNGFQLACYNYAFRFQLGLIDEDAPNDEDIFYKSDRMAQNLFN